jgi:hypothetical protein
MIHALVKRNETVIFDRTFPDPDLTREDVCKNLEGYIRGEHLHGDGICTVKVRFVK